MNVSRSWRSVRDHKPAFGWVPGKEGYRPVRTLFECALYKINLRVTCGACGNSTVIDAPGHWWRCEQLKKDDSLKAFVQRLYCQKCWSGCYFKRRPSRVEQTNDPVDGPLLPGPDHYSWKRIVNRQRS
jgi:hypothetical protein